MALSNQFLLAGVFAAFFYTVICFQQPFGISPSKRTSSTSKWHSPISFSAHQNSNRIKGDQRGCQFYHSTALRSLRDLTEEVSEHVSSLGGSSKKDPLTIFVGGKGGVGKTTVSSALAVNLASDFIKDLKVLVVSTDPAHSLGDALDEDLRKARGKPIPMTDPLTGGRLYACEVDAGAALQDFRENLAAFDINRLADALGVSAGLLEDLGLREFSGLLNNPPPGLDELVALSNVLDKDSVAGDFDVVIVDTAPTGHTLRLLALPQFLDGLLGKLINLRMKLSGLASTLQAFLGNAEADQRARAIDDAVNRLEKFRTKMGRLRQQLKDHKKTRFVVVTVPTKLGVAESKRLVSELSSQEVAVTDIVVNQCVGDISTESVESDALKGYYERRKAGQERWINKLAETIADVSNSEEFKSNGSPKPITLTQVPFFDVELVGVPALAYVGSQVFTENPSFSYLMNFEDESVYPKVVICGGKGTSICHAWLLQFIRSCWYSLILQGVSARQQHLQLWLFQWLPKDTKLP